VSNDDTGDRRHATVVRLLDDPALWAEVPFGLRERVVEAAARAAPADLTPRAPRHVARGAGRGPGRWRARRRPLVLAAAAAIVVCLGVAGGIRLLGDDTAPAPVEVALAGTEEAPDAAATARLRDEPSGVSVMLDVEGLAPAPAGTFYETWLVGEAGKVSAGTFHLHGDQDDIELWLGVDPDEYDAITVTRQPVTGGTTAEGVVVLRGELPPDA
jgi:Anti-sigma-K factor rskA, C-terminal